MKARKIVFLVMQLFYFESACVEGFAPETLVRTLTGYSAIRDISLNEHVLCSDSYNNIIEKPISFISKKIVSSYVCILVNDICIKTGRCQKFYCVEQQEWIRAEFLKEGTVIQTAMGQFQRIKTVEIIEEPIELYLLSVKDIHNFCISKSDIVVHNFVPIVVAIGWAFGLGGIELAHLSIGFAAGTVIGYSLYKKHQQVKPNIKVNSFGGGMFPEDPEEEDLVEKKRLRDLAREEHKGLKNTEARILAKELGFKETKDHPCGNTRNKPVFTDGSIYISPDADGHSGGSWKVFNSKGKLRQIMDKRLCKTHRTYL